MRPFKISLLIVIAASVVAPAYSSSPQGERQRERQGSGGQTLRMINRLNDFDVKFMREAAMGHMAEVKLGQYASKHAHGMMKDFGMQMVKDHGNALRELQSIAEVKDVKLPRQLDAKHKAVWDRLTSKTGTQFDRAYRAEMIEDHKKDVAAFTKASRQARDPEVKDYAAKFAPIVKMHLDMLMMKRTMDHGGK